MSRWCAVIVLCIAHAVAYADRRPIVVRASDRGLVAALADAFAPQGSAIVEVTDEPPAAIAELTAMSRTVAERERARAVVWLIADAQGTTLVAYDREVDRVLVRPLPYGPPFTASGAAETARAARTMLRALRIRDDEPEPTQPEVPVVPPPPPRPWPNIGASASFGGRYGRLGEDGVAELQLAALWRSDDIGVIAMVALSPQASLSSPSFMGDVSDNSFAIAARIPFVIAPRIGVAGFAGPALHAIQVEGTIGAESVSSRRYDAAVRVGAAGAYALTDRIDLGLSVSMDSLLKRQRYEVTGGEVLVMPRLQVSLGLMIAIRVL